MKNKDFKQRFLNENYTGLTEKAILVEFENISEYEDLINKDCSNFTHKEIMTYFKIKNSTSLQSLITINSYFIQYTSFAIRNNFVNDGINHYEEITRSDLSKCINSGKKKNMYVTEDELLKLINDPELNMTSREKYVLYALFCGLNNSDFSDIINVTKEDIHENMLTLKSGRVVEINAKLTGLICEACDEYEYTVSNGIGHRSIRFDPSDHCAVKAFLRKDSNWENIDLIKMRSINKFLAKIRSAANVPFTATSLSESGRIEYIKTLMDENESLYDCIIKNSELITQKYSYIRNPRMYSDEFESYFE